MTMSHTSLSPVPVDGWLRCRVVHRGIVTTKSSWTVNFCVVETAHLCLFKSPRDTEGISIKLRGAVLMPSDNPMLIVIRLPKEKIASAHANATPASQPLLASPELSDISYELHADNNAASDIWKTSIIRAIRAGADIETLTPEKIVLSRALSGAPQIKLGDTRKEGLIHDEESDNNK